MRSLRTKRLSLILAVVLGLTTLQTAQASPTASLEIIIPGYVYKWSYTGNSNFLHIFLNMKPQYGGSYVNYLEFDMARSGQAIGLVSRKWYKAQATTSNYYMGGSTFYTAFLDDIQCVGSL